MKILAHIVGGIAILIISYSQQSSFLEFLKMPIYLSSMAKFYGADAMRAALNAAAETLKGE